MAIRSCWNNAVTLYHSNGLIFFLGILNPAYLRIRMLILNENFDYIFSL
uniref:Uncharacterized protein n=1 Tax=Rhizophora mucronata TaxID=61149 RepID=A0A2P2IIM7_RHIMU